MNLSLNPFSGFMLGGSLWVFAGWVLGAIVHIAFAVAVLNDAELLSRIPSRRPFLVGSGIWGLATLLGGPITVAIYWLIHYSTLRSPLPEPSQRPAP